MAEWLDRYGPGNRKDVQILEQTEGWFALQAGAALSTLPPWMSGNPTCRAVRAIPETGPGNRAGVWSGWSVPVCCTMKSPGATTRPMPPPGCNQIRNAGSWFREQSYVSTPDTWATCSDAFLQIRGYPAIWAGNQNHTCVERRCNGVTSL